MSTTCLISMFIGRLNEAKAEAKADFAVLAPPTSKEDEAAAATPSTMAVGENAARKSATPNTTSDTATVSDGDGDIVERVSEFLFDLFDANCMDEYASTCAS